MSKEKIKQTISRLLTKIEKYEKNNIYEYRIGDKVIVKGSPYSLIKDRFIGLTAIVDTTDYERYHKGLTTLPVKIVFEDKTQLWTSLDAISLLEKEK